MKKLNKIMYMILILIIIGMGFTVYTVVSKENGDDVKIKAFSQVKNTETRLINLFNTMNNIQYENYKISISNIKQEDMSGAGSSDTQSSGENSSGSNSSGEEESSGGGGSKGEESGSSKEGNGSSKEEGKKYALEKAGILTNQDEINWDTVKSDVELMYTTIPTMTLDLYQTNINQEDILKFNQEYDNLSKAIKEEDKEKTLEELAKVYEYMPKFIENCTDDSSESIIARTKSSILNAYSVLDKEDWDSISGSIKSASEEFSKLLTNGNSETKNQYNINKVYIMLNEFQNAVKIEDTEIFLIKYKNIVEELNNL